MLTKIIVLICMVLILTQLVRALFSLIRNGGTSSPDMVKALAWRIGISMALFIFLMIAGALGWIAPHSL